MNATRPVGRLHVITDEVLQTRHDHRALAAMASRGGAEVVQLRDKRELSGEQRTAMAHEVAAALRGSGTGLVVNDHVEVARRIDAYGVHLGSDDVPSERARAILGPGVLIGRTANGLAQARAVATEPVDYLGVGPVFGTTSKARPAPPLGLDDLARIVAAVRVPVIAIGGIDLRRVRDVMATGAHGVAVLSAVVLADDPESATREFAREMARCRPRTEQVGR